MFCSRGAVVVLLQRDLEPVAAQEPLVVRTKRRREALRLLGDEEELAANGGSDAKANNEAFWLDVVDGEIRLTCVIT